jgi:hypothetical protein
MKTLISLFAAALLIAGCGQKQISWEYETFDWADRSEMSFFTLQSGSTNWGTGLPVSSAKEVLQLAGSQGWELTSIQGGKYFLKRPRLKDEEYFMLMPAGTIMGSNSNPTLEQASWETAGHHNGR